MSATALIGVDSPTIRDLRPEDRAAWEALWHGYLTFYRATIAPDVSERTWARLLNPDEPMHGAMAFHADRPVGLVHYLYHRSTWSIADVCYLEDLFVAAEARGQGVGARLIRHVHQAAGRANAESVYWLTHESNDTAMRLYHRVAEKTGFVHYRGTAATSS